MLAPQSGQTRFLIAEINVVLGSGTNELTLMIFLFLPRKLSSTQNQCKVKSGDHGSVWAVCSLGRGLGPRIKYIDQEQVGLQTRSEGVEAWRPTLK